MTLNGLGQDTGVITSRGFRIRRASASVTGFRPRVDDQVAERLEELDGLLRLRVFPAELEELRAWVGLPLTPRRATGQSQRNVGKWANGSLADKLRDQDAGEEDHTLDELIDAHSELAKVRYEFDATLKDRWNELDFNARTVLRHHGVRDLLVLRAHLLFNISTQPSLMNFLLHNDDGIREVVEYAVVSAARDYVVERQLRVKDIDNDAGAAADALRAAGLSFSSESFQDDAIEAMRDFNDIARYDNLIELGGVDPDSIPGKIKPRLVEYIKSSSVEVTELNAPFLVPMYLAKAATVTQTSSGTQTDDPFAVDFFVEDSSSLQVSTAAVKCASQLFYVMVLGDELGVFDAVRYFTHRYLFREGFAVEDPKLRNDLENYVFSEQFEGLDETTGENRMMRCTRGGERKSFYRQVFDSGDEPVPGGGQPNTDFARLWKILMLESARYLERVQSSPHPENYVSRQNVMQAVEDLQYNLSTTCVGMATVMTPLTYAELEFVVKRILGHQEVRKHLVPSGGSWWKVVEKLQANQGRRTRASVLHNKARIGYSLMRQIAEYTPSAFEQDGPFSEFISNVDAFITTQAILQEEELADEGRGSEEPAESWREEDGAGYGGYGSGQLPGMPDLSDMPGMPQIPGVSAPWPGMSPGGGTNGGTNGGMNGSPVGAAAGRSDRPADDWDF